MAKFLRHSSLVLSGLNLLTYSGAGLVAQVSNLLYRGFLIRNRHNAQKGCRLEVGDTAGWKPALRHRIYARMPSVRPNRRLRLAAAQLARGKAKLI